MWPSACGRMHTYTRAHTNKYTHVRTNTRAHKYPHKYANLNRYIQRYLPCYIKLETYASTPFHNQMHTRGPQLVDTSALANELANSTASAKTPAAPASSNSPKQVFTVVILLTLNTARIRFQCTRIRCMTLSQKQPCFHSRSPKVPRRPRLRLLDLNLPQWKSVQCAGKRRGKRRLRNRK